ncbi:substrate-binding domain-containing protein [Roseinatronobacter monicus]|uniref:Monosaccharide ABC transporter substrate-binding protein (CUT2 family) n=1 Tax=Roseinatronobacter monicus TaxID=393481 RepID=A0A543K3K4_9RHOB|nr:substrate-binding domain-containing protein [Roseinatronobacter monicus]TQM89657.1 monosaccharide ABC transporter substrate-binding protein (CUT2 family) [Roseinatronobacter monicus]
MKLRTALKLTTIAASFALGAGTVSAEGVDIDALVAEILAGQNTDLALHQAYAEAVSAPGTPFQGTLPDKTIHIGWTSPGFDLSDAWERYYLAFSARMEETGIPFEINLQAASSHDAHDQQLAHIEAFISQGVDYIVMGPTELEAQIPSYNAIHEAGIPLIITNYVRRLPGDDKTLMYTAFDHEVGGVMTGEWIFDRLEGKGKIGLMRVLPGDMDDQRFGGAWSVLENGDFEIVAEEFTFADRQLSFQIAENMMTAHPDIDLLFGLCSACALGGVPALEAMGLTGTVDIIGFGGIPEETALMQNGTFSGSVFRQIDDLGVAIAEAVKRHMEGRAEEIPAVFTGAYVMMDDTWEAEQFDAVNEYAVRYSGHN